MKNILAISLAILLLALSSCEAAQPQPPTQPVEETSVSGLPNTEPVSEPTTEPPTTAEITTEAKTASPCPNARSITDIADWDKLDLPDDFMSTSGEYIRSRYELFLSGNNSKYPRGEWNGNMYDCYDTLRFGGYTITFNPDVMIYHTGYLTLNIEIIQSGMEMLPPGRYSFDFDEYYDEFVPLENLLQEPDRHVSPAYDSLLIYLETIGTDMAAEVYQRLEGKDLYWYNFEIIEYVCNILNRGENGVTLEELNDAAKQYLNIDTLRRLEDINTAPFDGKYARGGHGGTYVSHRYVGETTVNGVTKVTIDFYADAAKTIRADTIEFTMTPVGESYAVTALRIVRESGYDVYIRTI